MVHLGTVILASHGAMAPLGRFLHPPDWPDWSVTTDYNGEEATIKGASVIDAENLGKAAVCLVVRDREKVGVIASIDTKVWSLDKEGWTALDDAQIGECIRIPDIASTGTVVTWGRISKLMPAPLPERLFMDANKMWGNVVLYRGRYSYATPAAFLHV